MNYKINGNILYNERDGTLIRVDDADKSVALIRSTSRLLSFLIRNNNELLLRERLLDEVLVDYGLKASNNNLNNYISILRRSLAQLGEENIIITYPRQGFKFAAQTIQELVTDTGPVGSIEKSGEGSEEEKTRQIAVPAIPDGNEPPATKEIIIPAGLATKNPGKKRHKNRLTRTCILTIISALLVLFSTISWYKNNDDIGINSLGSYKKCQIYTVRSGISSLRELSQMIQNNGFDCQKNANVYYYGAVKNLHEDTSMEVITFCPAGINVPCINSYINNNYQ